MKVNIEKLKKLVIESGGYNSFARKSGISVSYLYRALNGQEGTGKQFISLLLKYFADNNIDYTEYIFLF